MYSLMDFSEQEFYDFIRGYLASIFPGSFTRKVQMQLYITTELLKPNATLREALFSAYANAISLFLQDDAVTYFRPSLPFLMRQYNSLETVTAEAAK